MIRKLSKTFFYIVTISFYFSFCVSIQEKQKKAIENVLQEDNLLMQSAQNEIKNKKSKIDAFTSMTQKMRTINLESCPPDFSEVYRKHIYAWEDAVKQMKEKDNDFLGSLFEGIIGFATGNSKVALNALIKILGDSGVDMQQVQNTWREVELSATKYKAAIPTNQN
jgi:hypothetical protein